MRVFALLLGLSALLLAACGEDEATAPSDPTPVVDQVAPPRLSGTGSAVAEAQRPPPPPTAVPELPPVPVGDVAVQVVTADGTPVAGARVIGIRHAWTTDEDGRVRVGPFRGGHGMPSQFRRERTITVEAPGFVPVSHECEGGPRSAQADVVRLFERGSTLAGRCVDAHGVPVPDVALRVEYEQGRPARTRTEESGRFVLHGTARREGRLRVEEKGWTCRPVPVVPPQHDIELVVFRTAWIRGRFEASWRGGHFATLRVTTNQGWTRRLRPDRPFSIPCCPGEVEVTWYDRVLGRFAVEEGEVLEDVVLEVDITFPDDVERKPRPYVELDLSLLGGRETLFAAWFDDLGLRRLGYFRGTAVQRVELPSDRLRWLSVEPGPDAWRVPCAAGDLVRIERPALAPLTLRLVDAVGAPVREGWVGVRWAGTRRGAGHAGPVGSEEHQPPGTFRADALGPGTFDLAWTPNAEREPRLLLRGAEMPDPPAPLDLGTVVLPEPARLDVLVTAADGARVAGAVVRLLGRERYAAARADADGRALLVLPDPTALELEAEAPDGRTGRLRLADDDVDRSLRIVLDEAPD